VITLHSACCENNQAQGEGQGKQQEEVGQENQRPGDYLVVLIDVFRLVM
jgi:hypothetical protein